MNVGHGRRIDCPVAWCTGSWLDHGGDGAPPAAWVHSDDGIALVHGAALYRSQIGTGAVEWDLIIGGQVVAHGEHLVALAEKLSNVAGAVAGLAAGLRSGTP